MSVQTWLKKAKDNIIARVALNKCPFIDCNYKFKSVEGLFRHLMLNHQKHHVVGLVIDLLGL